MAFQIGKFFDTDKQTKTEAVGAIIYNPWNEEDGKCLVVVVVVENGQLKGVDTPHCFLSTEIDFKKAVKDFSKVAVRKTKPVYATYESRNAVQQWLISGMGLSDADEKAVLAELDEKMSNCLEFKQEGKHLKTNLFGDQRKRMAMKKKRQPAMGDLMDWVDRFVAWHDEPPEPVPPSEYTTTESLAELFNVRPWDEIREELWPEITKRRKAILAAALTAGRSQEAAFALAEEDLDETLRSVWTSWYQDLMGRVKEAFNRFHLEVEETSSAYLKIKPAEGKTWRDATDELTYSLHDYREPGKHELHMSKKNPRDFILLHLRDIAGWKRRDIR